MNTLLLFVTLIVLLAVAIWALSLVIDGIKGLILSSAKVALGTVVLLVVGFLLLQA